MQIDRLGRHRHWIPTLARWQFDYWGPLTGFDTLEQYVGALEEWSIGEAIPTVLVAFDGTDLAGSVNLRRSEMETRPALTPWLAQLFVAPGRRGGGIGAALVAAALAHAGRCGFDTLYLFTSGTLPEYYSRLGWVELERVAYLGKERAVMQHQVSTSC